MQLRPSDYENLSQALSVLGARVVLERSSPLGLITVVESPQVPLRHAPGMSLGAVTEPPAQLGVYTDGDGPGALTRFDGATGPLAYLDQLTSALPFYLVKKPRVLVLGAGTGADVLQALYHGAPGIAAVELDPKMIELVQQRYGEFSGRPYSAPGVRAHVAAHAVVAIRHDRPAGAGLSRVPAAAVPRADRVARPGQDRAVGRADRTAGIRDGHAVSAGAGQPRGAERDAVARAWGVNGFASMVAAIHATVLAIHLGFNAVVVLALLLYVAAAGAFPRWAAAASS